MLLYLAANFRNMDIEKVHDAIIVGAGPVGLYAGQQLKKKGIDFVILEEHDKIGEPRHCSGLISTNIEQLFPIDDSFIEHRVSGAVLHTPGGDIELKKKGTAAYIINRSAFDRSLARGLEPETINAKCESVSVGDDAVDIKTNRGGFRANLVLGCDGAGSLVARATGPGPRELVKGIIAIEPQPDSSGRVELWFDRSAAPDGFLWKIPRGKATEYGMLSNSASYEVLENFFGAKFTNAQKHGGIVPIGPRITYSDRTLLAGDAAGQTKPWSGGGVVYGMTAARIAADVAAKAIGKNDFSEAVLKEYEARWRGAIGRGISIGLMFREFYKEADEQTLKEFFQQMKRGTMNELDMDLLGF